MVTRARIASAFLATFVVASACTVHQTSAPSLTGPSEFALAVGVTAQPDAINQDGSSRSTVVVTAHDVTGKVKSGQTFRLDMLVNGTPTDYGTLSQRTLVTGSDGTASAIYTAPAAPPAGAVIATCHGVAGQCVSIAATAVQTDFSSPQTQSVEIRLMPTGIILPPGALPVASFVVTPTPLTVGQDATFDASGSCAEPLVSGACNPSSPLSPTITQYAWSYGDGDTAVGKTKSHSYASTGTYTVTLTVTNSAGLTASSTQTVVVQAGTPTASFTFASTGTHAITVDGSASIAVGSASISTYAWSWGDGNSNAASAASVASHTYAPGLSGQTVTVTLTVTDSLNRVGSTSQSVTVP